MRIYLDANILIYALESEGDRGLQARHVLHQVESGMLDAVTSEITMAEVLRGGNAAGDPAIFDAYIDLFSQQPGLQVVPISRDILIACARLEVGRKIELIDAIHVATALAGGCEGLLTEDARLSVPAGLKKLSLNEHLGAL